MKNLRMRSYKLVDKVPVPCSPEESMRSERRVDYTAFDGDITVSTVFLQLDHSFGDEEPVLFETLVFGGPHDGYMQRYHTWDEAINGHKEVCYLINKVMIDRNNKLDNLGI